MDNQSMEPACTGACAADDVTVHGTALGLTAPPKGWEAHRRFEPEPAVHWLSPKELRSSATRVGISSVFGSYADGREAVASLASPEEPYFEPHAHWVDYVADVGDGFDATYAVAEVMSRPELTFGDHTLGRGQTLVMGGDEIYPFPRSRASDSTYHERVVGPYEAALASYDNHTAADRNLSLYAIPGNHDWYDGLAAFRKQFLAKRWLGGRASKQDTTYFSIRLPGSWWLWGIDISFGGPIDNPQLEYFERAGRMVDPDHGIILCVAEPRWYLASDADPSEAASDEKHDDPYQLLRFFATRTLGDHSGCIRVMLTGDKHHYARYTEVDETGAVPENPRVKITAGGGGAYLLLTNGLRRDLTMRENLDDERDDHIVRFVDTPADTPTLPEQELHGERIWPSRTTSSRRLSFGVFARIWDTRAFALMLTGIYFAFAWLLRIAVGTAPDGDSLGLEGVIETFGDNDDPTASWWALLVEARGSLLVWTTLVVLWTAATAFANQGAPPRLKAEPSRRTELAGITWGLFHVALVAVAVVSVAAVAAWAAHNHSAIVLLVAIAMGAAASVVLAVRAVQHVVLLRILPLAASVVITAFIIVALRSDAFETAEDPIAYITATLVLSYVVGPFALAIYLAVAASQGRNLNDLSVACRYEGYRNFLRMRIDGDRLDIYAIGIEDTPKTEVRFTREPGERRYRLEVEGDRAEPVLLDTTTLWASGDRMRAD